VVRLSHEKGKRVLADVVPRTPADEVGSQHYFYTEGETGRYTGVFWFPQKSQVNEMAAKLRLIALDQAKQQAAHIPVKSLNQTILGPREIRAQELVK
jgi:hypothetical protein